MCLIPDRRGDLRCKRHAPFPCSPTAFIDENGKWNAKRIYAYFNSWCPAISVSARCNNDIKLLTNGPETKSSTIYATSYASKNQQKTYNLSAVTPPSMKSKGKATKEVISVIGCDCSSTPRETDFRMAAGARISEIASRSLTAWHHYNMELDGSTVGCKPRAA